MSMILFLWLWMNRVWETRAPYLSKRIEIDFALFVLVWILGNKMILSVTILCTGQSGLRREYDVYDCSTAGYF